MSRHIRSTCTWLYGSTKKASRGIGDVRTCCKPCTACHADRHATSCATKGKQECRESSTCRSTWGSRKASSKVVSESASTVSSEETTVRFPGWSLLLARLTIALHLSSDGLTREMVRGEEEDL
jgi:hypothetical protein